MDAQLRLNARQWSSLLERVDTRAVEAVIHYRVPLLHMEHCLFAAHVAGAKDHHTCGRTCRKHRIELRDRNGAAHPLLADRQGRTTLYHAVPQTAAEHLEGLVGAGVRHFRVELLQEPAERVAALLEIYARALAGDLDGPAAFRHVRESDPAGAVGGTWDRP
jgi:putative protease